MPGLTAGARPGRWGELMYQIESSAVLLKGEDKGRLRGLLRRRQVSRTVVLLGLTSLFTDVSAEMVATILPLYLVYALGATPLQFGLIDGLYQGAAAVVRVASGLVGDRSRRHKEVAAVGYSLSALCKLGLLAAGNAWGLLTAVILLDRTGKGVRTAPRDALISLTSTPGGMATAFGVHRALDTTGAMLGPLVAFGLLALVPGAFDAVFVVSFCFAVIGLAILVLFVQNPGPTRVAPARGDDAVSVRAALRLLGEPPFRVLVLAGAALGLATVSDGLLYVAVQRRLDVNPALLPLLYVSTALVYMLLAVPVGRLADAIGRARVFILGYAALALLYVLLLLPVIGPVELVVYVVLFGAFYAATDGVLMALASVVLPPQLRGTGLALLVTATSLARLVAAVVFGAVWTWVGLPAAAAVFSVGLLATLVFAALALARSTRSATSG